MPVRVGDRVRSNSTGITRCPCRPLLLPDDDSEERPRPPIPGNPPVPIPLNPIIIGSVCTCACDPPSAPKACGCMEGERLVDWEDRPRVVPVELVPVLEPMAPGPPVVGEREGGRGVEGVD